MGGIVIWLTNHAKATTAPRVPYFVRAISSGPDVLYFVPRSLDSPLAHTRHQKINK